MLPAPTRFVRLLLFFVTIVSAVCVEAQTPTRVVEFNDNRQAAGVVTGNVATVNLVVGSADWFPDGPNYPAIPIQAFGEDGQALTIPGPLLRVPTGTELVVSVRNDIPDTTVEVHGLYTRPAEADAAITIRSGQTRIVRFSAGEPGTYFYWATTTGAPVNQRYNVDSQLNGAFIVDEPGATPTDRIFVLGQWDEPLDGPATSELDPFTSLTGMGRGSFTINGRGWPLTERIAAEVGETFEWRWINPTTFPHPLHLHGHYFTVVATGSLLRETRLAPSQARQAVTERINQGNTMRIVATPERPGNWLFHCHLAAHMAGELRREPIVPMPSGEHHNHAEEGMAGMVLGVEVTGDGLPIEAVLPERRLTMSLDPRPGFFGPGQAGIGVTFSDTGGVAAPQATPGPPLLLTRGQPVRITIENHLAEETVIHWHGMELESYFDGVAGFSGAVGSVTPSIAPGGSFEARFTPPRSGTFIYHTHMGDGTQLPAGLYGAMIVSDAGRPFDQVTESIVVIGHVGGTSAGPGERLFAINGEEAATFRARAGAPHRFRLINITGNNVGFTVTLTSPAASVEWQAVAKDGAELPPPQRVVRPAHRQPVSVGETYDFEWTPPAPGPYWLEVRTNTGQWVTQAQVTVAP